jgi:hypothetical protein
MRNRIGLILAIALTLPVATTAVFGGEFGGRRHRPHAQTLLDADRFADVGVFTGALEGIIVLNGTPYRLAPNVCIYDVGRGVLPVGTFLGGCLVACSGVTLRGYQVVDQIIVRAGVDDRAVDTAPIRAVRTEDVGPR